MTGTPYQSEFRLTNKISYCSLIGKLLSVFCEYFYRKNDHAMKKIVCTNKIRNGQGIQSI